MLLGSYTITLLKEDREAFLNLYKGKISQLLDESDFTSEIALLTMESEIDPSAASFSLQVKFDSHERYSEFSTNDFYAVLALLNSTFPQRYAYFHTLLRYV